MNSKTVETLDFSNLGIAPKLLDILTNLSFTTPTPIQAQSIPVAIEGKDVIGIAQTGTGKTLAFGIPMLMRLASSRGIGLVLLPTRELALQVEESLARIGKQAGLRTAVLIGGESMFKQLRALKQKPHIVIATPGRLIDHINQKSISLAPVHTLVLDEADRMLDMGFAPQLNKILETVPKKRQTMLFSATMPAEIVSIAKNYMALPVRVEVAPAGSASKNVTQELFFTEKDGKRQLLKKILSEYSGSVLVFTRTKFAAKKVAEYIRAFGATATEIHSNRTLPQRLEALKGFKDGRYRVLVATDIAARGLDVTGIELVVNFDLPENPEDYVHRIGRTGRASHQGHAISFATPDQKRDVRDIERLIKKVLPVSKHELTSTEREEIRKEKAERPRYEDARPKSFERGPRRFGSAPRPAFSARPQRTFKKEEKQAEQPAGLMFRYGDQSVSQKSVKRIEHRFQSERKGRGNRKSKAPPLRNHHSFR